MHKQRWLFNGTILWWVSLGMHLALIWLAGFVSFQKNAIKIIGDNSSFINTYIQHGEMTQPALEKTFISQQERLLMQKKPALNAIVTARPKADSFQSQQKIPKQQVNSKRNKQFTAHSQGGHTEVLLTLLHAKIQAKQEYPLIAQELEREGRITVQFLLLEDGHIQQLQIIKPSAMTALDQAALAAVISASPFEGVEKYLGKPRIFRIDIVFKLT